MVRVAVSCCWSAAAAVGGGDQPSPEWAEGARTGFGAALGSG